MYTPFKRHLKTNFRNSFQCPCIVRLQGVKNTQLLLGRIASCYISIRCGLLLHVAWFVCVSACLPVFRKCAVSPVKMDEPIGVPIGLWTLGSEEQCIGWAPKFTAIVIRLQQKEYTL